MWGILTKFDFVYHFLDAEVFDFLNGILLKSEIILAEDIYQYIQRKSETPYINPHNSIESSNFSLSAIPICIVYILILHKQLVNKSTLQTIIFS